MNRNEFNHDIRIEYQNPFDIYKWRCAMELRDEWIDDFEFKATVTFYELE